MNRHCSGNDCGNCVHFHLWDFEREFEKWRQINSHFLTQTAHTKDSLHFGDCDRIAKGTAFTFELSDGSVHEAEYDGYSFEDECYDEYFHCFEPANNRMEETV